MWLGTSVVVASVVSNVHHNKIVIGHHTYTLPLTGYAKKPLIVIDQGSSFVCSLHINIYKEPIHNLWIIRTHFAWIMPHVVYMSHSRRLSVQICHLDSRAKTDQIWPPVWLSCQAWLFTSISLFSPILAWTFHVRAILSLAENEASGIIARQSSRAWSNFCSCFHYPLLQTIDFHAQVIINAPQVVCFGRKKI